MGWLADWLPSLFELGINWIYLSTFVALSHRTLGVFLLGSFPVVVVCSLGGGWLMARVDQSAAGSGIPQLKFAFWQDFGLVRLRTVLVKFFAGLLHVGGGMSLGREGPSVLIAGGVASQLSAPSAFPKQRRRRPAAAGAAAGLAAAFNTPLAAITFVLEEIVQDLNSPLIGSIILASVLGAFTVHAIIGKNPAFVLPQIENTSWRVYLGVPLASAVASLVGIGFQRATLRLRAFSKNGMHCRAGCIRLLGGLTVWLLGVGRFYLVRTSGRFRAGIRRSLRDSSRQIPLARDRALLAREVDLHCRLLWLGRLRRHFRAASFSRRGGRRNGRRPAGYRAASDRAMVSTLLAIIGMSACLSAVVQGAVHFHSDCL